VGEYKAYRKWMQTVKSFARSDRCRRAMGARSGVGGIAASFYTSRSLNDRNSLGLSPPVCQTLAGDMRMAVAANLLER